MQAEILPFPKVKKRHIAAAPYLLAKDMLFGDCNCSECRNFRRLVEIDQEKALKYLEKFNFNQGENHDQE